MKKKFSRFLYFTCKPLGEGGKRATGCDEHIALARRAAADGIVLLKNENEALPLSSGERIALFGNGTIDYVKSGAGSGNVHSAYFSTVYDGFKAKEKEGKVKIYEPLCEYYREQLALAERNFMPHQDFDVLDEIAVPDELCDAAAQKADTAIITLTRISSEGEDQRVEKGDMLLSDSEHTLIDQVRARFNKIIVVFNLGMMIESAWFKNDSKISAALVSWFGGMEGGAAIADVVCGDVNPSGKLVDTLAESFEDFPTTEGYFESEDYVNYTEDIFVGYRYFETFEDKRDRVTYPFGFGLSYTDFEISDAFANRNGDYITVAATVTNTGKVAGREVVQVYCEPPKGKLSKAARNLVAFKKTKMLEPNESETLAIRFPVYYLASYDDTGKLHKSAYLLEKGEYRFHIGNSVRNCALIDYTYKVEQEFEVLEQLETRCAPNLLEKRLLSDGSYEALPKTERSEFVRKTTPITATVPEESVLLEKVGESITLDEFIAQLTDEELIEQVCGQASTGIADTGSYARLPRLEIPSISVSDGPAGLRTSLESAILVTAFPCETALACTWDTDILYEMGKAGGKEFRENNLGVWLAPGMNIHRSPLCGRNYEYYSEDPLVSGMMAAAMVKGVQSQKVAGTIKHFACNNKETNRHHSDSRVSEKALREIYLKGFEICMKQVEPWIIMTAYNLINGCHTSADHELLEGIVRGEWGYKGMTSTDWNINAPHIDEVRAGNDIKMPKGEPEELKKALEEGYIVRSDLEACAKRIFTMILKLGS